MMGAFNVDALECAIRGIVHVGEDREEVWGG
jgi:hypothetical protein